MESGELDNWSKTKTPKLLTGLPEFANIRVLANLHITQTVSSSEPSQKCPDNECKGTITSCYIDGFRECYSTPDVLQIFRQLCAGLKHMHSLDTPYAHKDVKPANVLITHVKGQSPLAILMDFGSSGPARRQIHSRSEALQLQEWASEHCTAPYRAPELWDCPSHTDIDERTDIWSLGCAIIVLVKKVRSIAYITCSSL